MILVEELVYAGLPRGGVGGRLLDRRETIGSLGRGALAVEVRGLCSRLGSLGGGREGVVDGLGVPTGEIEVFVCAGHVGEQLGFRHVTGTSAEGDLGRRLSGDEDELAVARGARRRRAEDDG